MFVALENPHVLREVTDFGLGKFATVSTKIGDNLWLVLSERILHADPERVEWPRLIDELFSDGEVVEAQ